MSECIEIQDNLLSSSAVSEFSLSMSTDIFSWYLELALVHEWECKLLRSSLGFSSSLKLFTVLNINTLFIPLQNF